MFTSACVVLAPDSMLLTLKPEGADGLPPTPGGLVGSETGRNDFGDTVGPNFGNGAGVGTVISTILGTGVPPPCDIDGVVVAFPVAVAFPFPRDGDNVMLEVAGEATGGDVVGLLVTVVGPIVASGPHSSNTSPPQNRHNVNPPALQPSPPFAQVKSYLESSNKIFVEQHTCPT